MKLLLLGSGAIGVWIGMNLMRAGNRVTFVGRQLFVEQARIDGLRAQLPQGGNIRLTPVTAAESAAAAFAGDIRYDATLLCMKAFSLGAALNELVPFAAQSGRVVCFQNGVESEARAAEQFGAGRVVAATLTSPITQMRAGVIALDRLGGGVGVAPIEIEDGFCAALAKAGGTEFMPIKIYPDARAMKWSKLLLNIVGNASSALFRKDVAEIYADPMLFDLEHRMLRECLAVMRAARIPVIDLPGYAARKLAFAIEKLPAAITRILLAQRVAKGRGGKKPSFYYDVVNQTGHSEVESLNGQIVIQGAALGVPTPVNAWLTQSLLRAVRGAPVDLADVPLGPG